MTHKKHEIAVFIENEEMLQQAKELLEKYGEKVDNEQLGFYISIDCKELNYLQIHIDYWSLNLIYNHTLITIPQLEEILKNQ